VVCFANNKTSKVEGAKIMDEENRLRKARAARALECSPSGPFSPLPDTVDANAATPCGAPAVGDPFLLADADSDGIEGRLADEDSEGIEGRLAAAF
jgi:hypothetical protein